MREGGSDAEEEGEANRRVDSPPSADERDVERVDEDAAPTPAEDEKRGRRRWPKPKPTKVDEGDADEAEAGGFLREDVRRGW